MISRQDNSYINLTKEIDKDESCLRKCKLSECKLDLAFRDTQFQIANHNMFLEDRNKNAGGLLFSVNQNLICKIVNTLVVLSKSRFKL